MVRMAHAAHWQAGHLGGLLRQAGHSEGSLWQVGQLLGGRDGRGSFKTEYAKQ